MSLIVEFIIWAILFIFLTLIVNLIYVRVRFKSNSRLFKMDEYLPSEEIQTLKQVFYLTMMTLFLIDLIHEIIFPLNEHFYLVFFDGALCLLTIVYIFNKDKNKLPLLFGLIPLGTFCFLTASPIHPIIIVYEVIHILTLIYMIKYFYDLFRKYTSLHSLGHTILLLYGIIFFSFIWTTFVENVNLLDSLAMVSNAFTSNGYAILGTTVPGKLNSIFLVWAGYVLSSAGTATLTVAILKRHYEKRLDNMEKMIKDLHDKK